MCEFCTKHGEGKKWYLQMKRYSEDVVHQKLSAAQRVDPSRGLFLGRGLPSYLSGKRRILRTLD